MTASMANTPPTSIKDRAPYDGAELRRTPGIPDERFEAFELPSLVNGKRVPRRKPIINAETKVTK